MLQPHYFSLFLLFTFLPSLLSFLLSPNSLRISGGTDACVITAGDSAKLSTAPRL